MAKSYRREQLASLIQKELGEIIAKNIEFPSGSLATISEVTVSKDLEQATIWISVIPREADEEVLEILKKSRGFLRRQLGSRLRIKVNPRIDFELDRGSERAAQLEKLLLDE